MPLDPKTHETNSGFTPPNKMGYTLVIPPKNEGFTWVSMVHGSYGLAQQTISLHATTAVVTCHPLSRSVMAPHHQCRDAHRRGGVVDGAGRSKKDAQKKRDEAEVISTPNFVV